eukprot:gnl/TRDRNA2_/TRDRNA2_175129_c0_seq1.p1 gnl/TRDRNA2_/TRDRNA2_175129_c0~~gnl/TRDRNA2_/TRDRNA2_175129_c0_seq1.p1  ORF type:complete len:390 (+),score=43.15 gnl/TRDRNA2_/TRDRNA2_175129_c0_seq1:147-1172(+)
MAAPMISAVFVGRFFWALIDRESCAETAGFESPLSGLKVLVAGASHTGTNSIIVALQQMGMRAYHHEDMGFYASHALRHDNIGESWARPISRCQVEALALEPWTERLQLALRTSPGVKVILGVRDWEGHNAACRRYLPPSRHSLAHAIAMFGSASVRTIPWLHIWDSATGIFTAVLRKGDPIYHAGITFPQMLWNYGVAEAITFAQENHGQADVRMHRKFYFSEEAFLAYYSEVESSVPPENVLRFDVRRHGWAELESFLGRPRPANSTHLPRVNARSGMQHAIMDARPDLLAACLSVFIFCHIVNFVIARAIIRLLSLGLMRLLNAVKLGFPIGKGDKFK